MKVLFVTNMWPSDDRPADGSFVADLFRCITTLGVEAEVFQIRPGGRGPLRYALGAFDYWLQRRNTRYDVVHAHYGLSAAVALVHRSSPVLATFCGSDLYKPGQQVVSRWAGQTAQRSIVMSLSMRDRLGRADALILPYGIDLSAFRPQDKTEARQRLGLSPEMRYVLFPYNRSRAEKRFPLAAQAVEEARRHTGLPIEILEVHGRSREDYVSYVNAADAMLLVSLWEGSPNAVKECLASEVPVVSVDVGDVREILDAVPGCSVRSDSPQDLAAGLATAFAAGRATGGPQRMLPYARERIAERVVDVYRQMVH